MSQSDIEGRYACLFQEPEFHLYFEAHTKDDSFSGKGCVWQHVKSVPGIKRMKDYTLYDNVHISSSIGLLTCLCQKPPHIAVKHLLLKVGVYLVRVMVLLDQISLFIRRIQIGQTCLARHYMTIVHASLIFCAMLICHGMSVMIHLEMLYTYSLESNGCWLKLSINGYSVSNAAMFQQKWWPYRYIELPPTRCSLPHKSKSSSNEFLICYSTDML